MERSDDLFHTVARLAPSELAAFDAVMRHGSFRAAAPASASALRHAVPALERTHLSYQPSTVPSALFGYSTIMPHNPPDEKSPVHHVALLRRERGTSISLEPLRAGMGSRQELCVAVRHHRT